MRLGFTDDAILKSLMALLEALDWQVGVTDAKVASVAINDEGVKLLMTVPGLGCFAASLLLAEICDVTRFSSDKKLVAWAGLAPSIHQSGGKAIYGMVGKGGNKLVRWVMVQAAQAAVRCDERFREFYSDMPRERFSETIVAVAHEMLRIVYFMLKRNEPYRGERRELSRRKLKSGHCRFASLDENTKIS